MHNKIVVNLFRVLTLAGRMVVDWLRNFGGM